MMMSKQLKKMNNVLLVTEQYIKTNSGLDENVYGKFLIPAIREAQEMGLQTIIGTALYDKVCAMVADGSIHDDENWDYKYALDKHFQPYLMYMTIASLIPVIGTKITNLGTVVTNDEHTVNLSKTDRDGLVDYYEQRSTHYARAMQKYLTKNRILYPELNNCDCEAMQANLKSASVSPIWLGGVRGKKQ